MERTLLYTAIGVLLFIIMTNDAGKNIDIESQKDNSLNTIESTPSEDSSISNSNNQNNQSNKNDICVKIPAFNLQINCYDNSIKGISEYSKDSKLKLSWNSIDKNTSWIVDKNSSNNLIYNYNENFFELNANQSITLRPLSNPKYSIIYYISNEGFLTIKFDSNGEITQPYGLISIPSNDTNNAFLMSHEGFSMYNQELLKVENFQYTDLKPGKLNKFYGNNLWTSLLTKNWIMSLKTNNSLQSRIFINNDYMQTDILLNKSDKHEMHSFIGRKTIDNINAFKDKNDIHLFDKTIDYGVLIWIVKPLYYAFSYLSYLLSSPGLAIILITLILKSSMIPIYKKIRKLKDISPKIQEVQKIHSNNRDKMLAETMAIYKSAGISPFTGFLPIIFQIPLFFGVYKMLVISTTIVGVSFLIFHDLSEPDMHRLTNLFGILEISNNQGVLQYLDVSILGILLSVTFYLTIQNMTLDPNSTMGSTMRFMPFIMLFVANTLPSGLIIYWTSSNIFSIAEEYIFKKISNKNSSINGNLNIKHKDK